MQNQIFDLLRFDKNAKYCIFDFETEGLNLLFSKPWQIGFILAKGNDIIDKFNFYLKWDNLNISPEAAKRTRFNYSDYIKKAKDPKEILSIFEDYLYDKSVIPLFYNGLNFDCYIHSVWRRNLGLEPDYSYLNRSIDVQCLAKGLKMNFLPPNRKNEDEFLAWGFKVASFKQKGLKTNLATICKENDIEQDLNLAHEALYDAIKTFEVWNKIKHKIDI